MTATAELRDTRAGYAVELEERRAPTAPLHEELTGRYDILERIGQGGMGVVFRARHVQLGREVALKLIRARFGGSAEVLERLRREAIAASRARSPHVVEVLDYAELPDGSAYIAMELLTGEDLGRRLETGGALGWRAARRIALQIAHGLASLHGRGVVHRDLKPDNVLLIERDGVRDHVKLLDLGLARVDGVPRITQPGLALGTPHYMSPEQCLGDPVGPATDIYALGTVLYEMVAGRVPFETLGFPGILAAQVSEPAPDVRIYAPELPEEAAQLIMRALAKDPAERPRTAADFAAAIARVDAPSASRSGIRRIAPRERQDDTAARPLAAADALPTLAPASRWRWLDRLAPVLAALGLGATLLAGAVAIRDAAHLAHKAPPPAMNSPSSVPVAVSPG